MKPLDVLLILVSLLFATGLIVDQTWAPERERHRDLVRLQQTQLKRIEDRLQDYHETNQRYPTMEEGLEAVKGLREDLMTGDDFRPAREFLRSLPGIRTVHGIPYVYENRLQGAKEAFAASPAAADQRNHRRWSKKVDDGIFVSSIGLRQDVSRVFGRAWVDALLVFSGGIGVVLGIAYAFARNRKTGGDRVRGINAMVMVGVALLLAVMVGAVGGGRAATRAASGPAVIGARRADLLEEWCRVMRSFSTGGAYSAEHLAKQEELLRAEFGVAVAPATAPSGG